MKKIAILLSLVLCTTITGCGKITISFEDDKTTSSIESPSTSSQKDEEKENTSQKPESTESSSVKPEDNSSSSLSQSSGAVNLGNDLYNQKFELHGKEYLIGVSVEDLIKDGWSIYRGTGQKIPGKGSLIGVRLNKGKEVISVTVYNKSPNEAEVEKGIISQIGIDDTDNISSFSIACGINMESSKEDVEKAFANYKSKTNETDMLYSFETNDNFKYYVQVYVSKKSNKVSKINIRSVDL